VPLSYRLHAELASEHNGAVRWGYRPVNCASIDCKARHLPSSGANAAEPTSTQNGPKKKPDGKAKVAVGVPKDLDWIDENSILSYAEQGNTSNTAQVHPFLFTNSMAELAVESGAEIILGRATAIDYTGTHGVKGVTYEEKATGNIETLHATEVVLAAGPWTTHIWPSLEMDAMRVHSVVVEAEVTPYALFTEIQLPKGWAGSKNKKTVAPELYARPDGTVYACGEGDTLAPLPKTAGLVLVDESRAQDILDYVSSISKPLREGKMTTKQACYLPAIVGHPGPLIGETGIKGLLMATGHTCWGIQNSCATGKLISEIVFEGEAKSARIETLDPRRVLG